MTLLIAELSTFEKLLIGAIMALCGAIVFMFFHIIKIYKKHNEKDEERTEKLATLANSFLQSVNDQRLINKEQALVSKAAMDSNTEALRQHTITLKDVHDYLKGLIIHK